MGSRTAISAGILAVALAAIPAAAPPATALSRDCERGGGLLSGLTGGLCDAVEAVTGTVDTATGGLTEPVTKGVEEATGNVLGKAGEAAPTAKPAQPAGPAAKPSPTGSKPAELLPEALGQVCLPVLACQDQGVLHDLTSPTPAADAPRESAPIAAPTTGPTSAPTGRAPERDGLDDTAALPTDAATPPATQLMDTGEEPLTDEPRADLEDLRIDLLWPNPFAEELAVPMRRHQVVRPTAPASDAAGTTLTIVLLASAVLATRIVQQRKRGGDQPGSIPFEPARQGNSRHRLA